MAQVIGMVRRIALIRIDIFHHFSTDPYASVLKTINEKLDLVLGKENQMAVDLKQITDEVNNNTSVTQSVVTLVNNLADIIRNIPPSTDPATQAAIDQLVATLGANDSAIANAVTANTGVTPPA